MTLICQDWRELATAEAEALLSVEAREWRATLDWDVRESWRALEPARTAGRLAGTVVRTAQGDVVGWACFLNHRHTLQVAILVAATPAVTQTLVEHILESPESRAADTRVVSVREAAPGLGACLRESGFGVTPYRYLSMPLVPQAPPSGPWRPWESSDFWSMAKLCARAYDAQAGVRAFAPNGSMDEWLEYIVSLSTSAGCGQLRPDASFVVPAERGGLRGAVMTSRLSADTAHIVQLAVDPSARRQGLARALVLAAAAASAAECRRLTLLVSAENASAVSLYERLGFEGRATFLVAAARQPTRSTSVALAAGGASTLR